MPVCAACGVKVLELDSYQCIGLACERRLCIPCHSKSFGFCPRCRKLDDMDRDQHVPGAGWKTMEEHYQELAEVEVWEEVEEEKEEEPEDKWWFDEVKEDKKEGEKKEEKKARKRKLGDDIW